jgi:hypothetical protein
MTRSNWTCPEKEKINEGNRSYQSKIWGVPAKRPLPEFTDTVLSSPGASPPPVPSQSPGASSEAGPSEPASQTVLINEASTSTYEGIKKRRRQLDGRAFQEIWSGQFPWCRELVREDGEVAQVECKVCT